MAGDMQADIPDSGAVFTYGRSRFANNVASYFFIRNDPIAEISCGDEHTAVVCQNGRVFAFGSNSWGQLGLGHKNTITMPSCMKSLKPEKANQIACGKSHTVISTVSGKVFTCGSNTEGQLGIPDVSEKTNPTQVTGIEVKPGGIKQVSAGCLHSACLTDDGKVYVWGSNSDGQLGLGEAVATADVPTTVKLPKPAVRISCGYYHTAFLTDDGKLYICGEGENGKLGLSETGNVFTPTAVGIDSPVEFVACGGNHTIAITKNGDVYGFGSNFSGQLGLGSKVPVFSVPQLISALKGRKIRFVACGESHTAFVSDKGHLFMCGDGRYGKLCKDVDNDAQDVSEYTPQRVERFDKYNVTLVACGGCHTMVQAATNTSDGGKSSPSRNNGVSLVLDKMEDKSPIQDLKAGDSVNPSPKSSRLPPLHVTPGREKGSILDSPSVEIAPESALPVEQTNGSTSTPAKNIIAVFESTKDSDDGSSEGDDNRQLNGGGDVWRPNGESLDEVLHKLNVRDASDLENDVAAVEKETKAEIDKVEGMINDTTDKMAKSSDAVVLSEVTKKEPEPESNEGTENEEVEEEEKQDEEKSNEENVAPEVEIDLSENGEDKEENEVVAEQKNDTETPKDETNQTAEKGKFESRMSKFLNTFRRKKLSEENVSLSPAWTTVDRRISGENTLVNRTTDKPAATNVKFAIPQRSKACVIL